MNIIATPDTNVVPFTEYFDFNNIEYKTVSLWDSSIDEFGRSVIPEVSDKTLLIMEIASLKELMNWHKSRQQLIDFCCAGNKIWVTNIFDALNNTLLLHKQLREVDYQIPKKSILLFLDAELSDRCILSSLNNISITSWPFICLFRLPRIKNAVIDKRNAKNDFLLTMVKKRTRPHRKILWEELTSRAGLINNSIAVYHTPESLLSNHVGDTQNQSGWQGHHPSMDLYLNCWLEIVPETLYKNGQFPTEKTIKPIATKTPFLMVSTCGYLGYLRSIGFKTFDCLIDESYDNQYRIQDRVKLMVDQLEDIVRNGSEDFYHASRHILDYNHQRLAEISGKLEYTTDLFIDQKLSEINIS